MLACDVAPAKTRAKASRRRRLLALPVLRPNWLLALDGQALAAINLGFFNSCQPSEWGCIARCFLIGPLNFQSGTGFSNFGKQQQTLHWKRY